MNSNSSIATLKANAAVHLTGKGKVDTLQVGSDDISYATTPGSITYNGNYDTPIKGGVPVGVDNVTWTTGGSDDEDDDENGPLAAPTGLSLVYNPAADTFTASWTAVAHSSGYRLVPVVGGSSGSIVSVSAGTTSYTLSNTSSYLGKTLALRFARSARAHIRIPLIPPPPPRRLSRAWLPRLSPTLMTAPPMPSPSPGPPSQTPPTTV